MPVWAWILIILAVILLGIALVLLRKGASESARSISLQAAQDLNDVLKAWEQTDDKLREWTRDQLLYLDRQAQNLEDRAEDLYGWTMSRVKDVRRRVAEVVRPKE